MCTEFQVCTIFSLVGKRDKTTSTSFPLTFSIYYSIVGFLVGYLCISEVEGVGVLSQKAHCFVN